MAALEVRDFRLTDQGAPISARLSAGSMVGLVGPAEVAVSRLLAEFAGKAGRGKLGWIDPSDLSGRATVQSLVKPAGPDGATRILTLLNLWEVRRSTVSSLGLRQRRAVALLPVLANSFALIAAEEALDDLDPWTLPGALEGLAEHAATKLIMSSRPDVLERCDRILVLHDRGLRFDGAPADLLRIIRPATVEIETDNPGAVAAFIEPLELRVESAPGLLRVHTAEGQKLAADLCLQGYPYVKAISVRTPTLSEALLALIR